MKTKYCLFILILMALNMPLVAYSQCADIFKQGVSLMQAKKYKSAISYFQKAKKCDESLSKQCDEKIRECRKHLPKPDDNSNSGLGNTKLITVTPENLNFGAEETGAKSVKVTSGADWSCTSDADWCTVVKKNDNSLSVNCKINRTAAERTATIRVSNGKETKNVSVIQEGMEAILKFAPNQSFEFGKEGVEYREILLNNTIKYQVNNQPEWVTIFREDVDMIAIKVEPMKRGDYREGIFSIVSLDGTQKDYVVIKQYKKLQKPAAKEDENEAKKKKGKRKTFLDK